MRNLAIFVGVGVFILLLTTCGTEDRENISDTMKKANSDFVTEKDRATTRLIGGREDGEDGKIGDSGMDGDDGIDGVDGADGRDGRDGVDGKDGKDGKDAILAVIDPCSAGGERLFVMNTGCIAAYFEIGGKRYLTCLEDGNYATTDDESCTFSIVDGNYVP